MFDASSSTPDGGELIDPTSYAWDFGDGFFGTGMITNHTYADPGTYMVTLNVTDSEGLSDTMSKSVTVSKAPVADFTYSPLSPLVGEVVTFNASTSTPDGGTIISYDWDFGDFTTASGMVVTHAYSVEGNYTVTLTITDSEGLSDMTSKSITVRKPPVADFTYLPLSPLVGETVTFDASGSTPDGGTIVSYDWDFGDGTTGSGVVVTHAYATFGSYVVNLTITDSEGLTDWTTKTVTVYSLPVAVFTYSPPLPLVGENVTFDASASYDPDGTIVSWDWDFGDGNVGSGVVVTHAYAAAGNFTVTLTVTDDDGATDTATDFVTVILVPPDVAVLSVEPSATEAYPTWVVPLNITVIVENQGPWPETFDVIAYYNETAIETKTVTVASRENTTLIFSWNLTGVAEGTYTIRAEASIVPGETDTADNTLTDGTVKLKHPGDANDDGVVDAYDLGILGKAWQTSVGDPDYDPRADFNGDGTVDEQDEAILQQYWPRSDHE